MQYIKPDWPAPENIRAFSTTRHSGNSLPPYSTLNLAQHVGDNKYAVENNRKLLKTTLNLPSEPIWLKQIHSNKVINIDHDLPIEEPTADASITNKPNKICIVTTADCLPILLCNHNGTVAAAIHAGWRGLASGIIENTIRIIDEPTSKLIAWLGPAIGPKMFEVSEDILNIFVEFDVNAKQAFIRKPEFQNKWLANIYLLAKQRLNTLGISNIYGGNHCTYTEEKFFYSYRRDHQTGRMASLIWLSV